MTQTYASTSLWSAVCTTRQATANTSSQNAVLGHVKNHLHAHRAPAKMSWDTVLHLQYSSSHGSAPRTAITSFVDMAKGTTIRRTRLNAGKGMEKLLLIFLLEASIYTVYLYIYISLIRDHIYLRLATVPHSSCGSDLVSTTVIKLHLCSRKKNLSTVRDINKEAWK